MKKQTCKEIALYWMKTLYLDIDQWALAYQWTIWSNSEIVTQHVKNMFFSADENGKSKLSLLRAVIKLCESLKFGEDFSKGFLAVAYDEYILQRARAGIIPVGKDAKAEETIGERVNAFLF